MPGRSSAVGILCSVPRETSGSDGQEVLGVGTASVSIPVDASLLPEINREEVFLTEVPTTTNSLILESSLILAFSKDEKCAWEFGLNSQFRRFGAEVLLEVDFLFC